MRNEMAELIKEELAKLDNRNDDELKREADEVMAFDILKRIKCIVIEAGESKGYNSEVLFLRFFIDDGEGDLVYTSLLRRPRDWTTSSISGQFINILGDIYSILNAQREQKGGE